MQAIPILPRKPSTRQSGLVLLAVLIFLLLTTLGASAMVELQRTHAQRAREEELLFVGDQYRRAIKSYYSSVPAGKSRTLPRSLDDLLEDKRFPMPVRHLRRLYPDPMTGKADWVLVPGAGGILGVHSSSTLSPFKKREFPIQYRDFQDKETYADWVFVAVVN
jgi:type II secretory pathway pseudopilin PulG